MANDDRVIVVAPSPTDFSLIQGLLSSYGIEALPASCLLEAVLHQAATLAGGKASDSPAPASVILYDTDAPEHWRQALEQFLRIQPASRVIFLSRLADEGMWMDVLQTGGYDLVMKPLRAHEIYSVVRSALRRVSSAAA